MAKTPLNDEAIHALMDHEFAVADGKIPRIVSVLGVILEDTKENTVSGYFNVDVANKHLAEQAAKKAAKDAAAKK